MTSPTCAACGAAADGTKGTTVEFHRHHLERICIPCRLSFATPVLYQAVVKRARLQEQGKGERGIAVHWALWALMVIGGLLNGLAFCLKPASEAEKHRRERSAYLQVCTESGRDEAACVLDYLHWRQEVAKGTAK